ncbi:MAG: hypothetical protein U5Q03_11265 [Bacteroidota bacterium]|nr:hypothetical protein [Bacteroidota bacterium]
MGGKYRAFAKVPSDEAVAVAGAARSKGLHGIRLDFQIRSNLLNHKVNQIASLREIFNLLESFITTQLTTSFALLFSFFVKSLCFGAFVATVPFYSKYQDTNQDDCQARFSAGARLQRLPYTTFTQLRAWCILPTAPATATITPHQAHFPPFASSPSDDKQKHTWQFHRPFQWQWYQQE